MRTSITWFVLSLGALVYGAENVKIEPLSKATEADIAKGKRLFAGQCAPCHGPGGAGGTGANLAQPKLKRAKDDQAIYNIIHDGIAGTEMPAAPAMDDHEVWLTAAFVRTLGQIAPETVPGDPVKGAAIYRGKANCLSCHMVSGEGGRLGPELTAIGFKRSAAHLRQSIVDPEADFVERFAYLRVTLPGAKTISGVRISEDTFAIQMMDTSGKPHSFWKKNLAKIEILKGKSPMPSYKATLTSAELDDLISYLVSLRGEE